MNKPHAQESPRTETVPIESRVCSPKGKGKGSHTYWIHPDLESPLIMPGKDGDDAPRYLEQQVNKALQLLAILEEDKNNDSSDDNSNDES